MIPKADEIIKEFIPNGSINLKNYKEEKEVMDKAMKEYGRRLLDHVAEKSVSRGFLSQEDILKIKDEL